VDRHGLPLSVSTHAANHHEVTLVQLSFDFYMIEAKPENLIGDKAYDSDALDESLKKQGVEMIAPHRSNRKLKTQDQRPCDDTSAVGWWSAISHGCSGNVGYSCAGSTTQSTSSASCNLPASPCS